MGTSASVLALSKQDKVLISQHMAQVYNTCQAMQTSETDLQVICSREFLKLMKHVASNRKDGGRRQSFDNNGNDEGQRNQSSRPHQAPQNWDLSSDSWISAKTWNVDSWDSVTSQPFCDICNMVFKTSGLLGKHTKFSRVHQQNIELKDCKTSTSLAALEMTETSAKQIEGVHFTLLYSGVKHFWRSKSSIVFDIYHHISSKCIEVIPFDETKFIELERLFLNYEAISKYLALRVDSAVNQRMIEIKAKDRFARTINKDKIYQEILIQTIVKFTLQHLSFQESNDSSPDKCSLTALYNDKSIEGLQLSGPPSELVPVSIARGEKPILIDSSTTIKSILTDQMAVYESLNEADKSLASNEVIFQDDSPYETTFEYRVASIVTDAAKYMRPENFVAPSRWKWAIRKVINQLRFNRCCEMLRRRGIPFGKKVKAPRKLGVPSHIVKASASRVDRPKPQNKPVTLEQNLSNRRKSFDKPEVPKKAAVITRRSLGLSESRSTPLLPPISSTSERAKAPKGETEPSCIDCWDSASEQPFCSICQIAFQSMVYLERHVKFSDMHLKHVTQMKMMEDEGLADPFYRLSPYTNIEADVVEDSRCSFKLLYFGSKSFARTAETLDLHIYHHSSHDCIEVICYNVSNASEISRHYFDYHRLRKLVLSKATFGNGSVDENKKLSAISTFIIKCLQFTNSQINFDLMEDVSSLLLSCAPKGLIPAFPIRQCMLTNNSGNSTAIHKPSIKDNKRSSDEISFAEKRSNKETISVHRPSRALLPALV